jgi:hypothetical protein
LCYQHASYFDFYATSALHFAQIEPNIPTCAADRHGPMAPLYQLFSHSEVRSQEYPSCRVSNQPSQIDRHARMISHSYDAVSQFAGASRQVQSARIPSNRSLGRHLCHHSLPLIASPSTNTRRSLSALPPGFVQNGTWRKMAGHVSRLYGGSNGAMKLRSPQKSLGDGGPVKAISPATQKQPSRRNWASRLDPDDAPGDLCKTVC